MRASGEPVHVEVARSHGFREVEVIDEDLRRSASGAVERPGFDRLVAELCAGSVGAVVCLEASRHSSLAPRSARSTPFVSSGIFESPRNRTSCCRCA
jgi:hypothetical protein